MALITVVCFNLSNELKALQDGEMDFFHIHEFGGEILEEHARCSKSGEAYATEFVSTSFQKLNLASEKWFKEKLDDITMILGFQNKCYT